MEMTKIKPRIKTKITTNITIKIKPKIATKITTKVANSTNLKNQMQLNTMQSNALAMVVSIFFFSPCTQMYFIEQLQEVVTILQEQLQVSRELVFHALIINDGDVSLAKKFLLMQSCMFFHFLFTCFFSL